MDSITIYLNIHCNIDCDYCFVRKTKSFMSPELLKETLNWFMNTAGQGKIVNFLGGEPLLSSDLLVSLNKEIKALRQNKCVEFGEIPTNGILVDENLLKVFKDIGLRLAFSLDGLQFEHNRHRFNKKATFDKVIRNLEIYTKVIGTPRIKCTVHPQMAQGLDKRVAEFLEHGFSDIQILPAYAMPWDELQIEDFRNSMERIVRFYLKVRAIGSGKIQIQPVADCLRRLADKEDFEGAITCQLGKEPVVMPDGKVFACSMSMNYDSPLVDEFLLGHVLTGVDLKRMKLLNQFMPVSNAQKASCSGFPSFCCRRIFNTNTRTLATAAEMERLRQVDEALFKSVRNAMVPCER